MERVEWEKEWDSNHSRTGCIGFDEQPIAQVFTRADGQHAIDEFHAEEAHGHCDDAAQQGNPCQQTGPGTIVAYPAFGAFQLFGFHFGPALNPFLASHTAYAIVEKRTECVSCCAPNEKFTRIGSCSEQTEHDHFRREGEKAAGKEGRYEHAGSAVVDEKVDECVHTSGMGREIYRWGRR